MAGVGVCADRVKYGYEEAVVTKARAGIVSTQARIEVQITTNRNESKGQNKDVDGDDGVNAKIRCAQLRAPEKCENKRMRRERTKLQEVQSQGHFIRRDGMQRMRLTDLQQIRPTRKNQCAAKKGVKKNALPPPELRGVSFV